MGRNRKATIIKLTEGTFRADRDKKNIEYKPVDEVEIPNFVVDDAREIFEKLVREINGLKLLWKIDVYNLGLLANDIFEYGEVIKEIGTTRMVPAATMGEMKRNPLLMYRKELKDSITSRGKMYGFDPHSRMGLPIEIEDAEDQVKSDDTPEGDENLKQKWGSV